MGDQMREALEAAYARHEPEEPVEEVVEAAPAPADPAPPVEEVAETPEAPAEEPSSPSEEPEAPQEPEEMPEAAAPPPAAERVPASWKASVKEHWDALPPEVRQEVVRREKETNQVLRESSAARKFQREFDQLMAPHQQTIAAENSTPLQTVQNLLQTAAVLRGGSQQQKAQLLASAVSAYGVDINALSDAIVTQGGNVPTQDQSQIAQIIDQRMAPMQQFMQQLEQARMERQQAQDAQIDKDYADFLDSGEAHYFDEVKEDMADILELAGRRGNTISFRDAYQRALALHPELQAQETQRQQALKTHEAAQVQKKTLAEKKRAASSLPSASSAGNGVAAPVDMRDQLAAAWDAMESGSV